MKGKWYTRPLERNIRNFIEPIARIFKEALLEKKPTKNLISKNEIEQ